MGEQTGWGRVQDEAFQSGGKGGEGNGRGSRGQRVDIVTAFQGVDHVQYQTP